MNAEKIRAEAIRRAAQAIEDHQIDWGYGAFYSGCGCGWDAKREHEDEFPQHIAGAVLDALGDMLPTQSEWSVVYNDPDHWKVLSTFCQRREDAEHQIRCNEDEFHDGRSSLARRFLTAWQEVTE